jgi:hypothetical protein
MITSSSFNHLFMLSTLLDNACIIILASLFLLSLRYGPRTLT